MAGQVLEFSVPDEDLLTLKRLQLGMDSKAFTPKILNFLNRQALIGAGLISKNNLSGQILKRRTGELSRAVFGRAELIHGVPAIRIGVFRGPALKYARAQELGAEISPINAKALAIPINDALTPAGVPRYQSPKLWPTQLKFVPFRNSGVAVGALYPVEELARIRKEHLTLRSARAAYLLLRHVTMPARNWLLSGVRAFLPQLSAALSQYIRDTLSGSNAIVNK